MQRQIDVLFWLILAICLAGCSSSDGEISGITTDMVGQPLSGVTVRIQTTKLFTVSGPDGRFRLVFPQASTTVSLTASAPGYFIAGPITAQKGEAGIRLELKPYPRSDNPNYSWQPSLLAPGSEETGCAACHQAEGSSFSDTLPVDEWQQDAHANSVSNPRFLTMYLGTDLDGNRSPNTRYVSTKDYGTTPIRANPNTGYFGPGYRIDFPETSGNCATCHAPAAAIYAPFDTNPSEISDPATAGIPCDFCHKIVAVNLDPITGLPYQNLPGVLSFQFCRPNEGHQFFAGPLDDVAPGEDVYSPLQNQSQFCAPCHHSVFWDIVIYDSFGEWLRSPYSNPETGQSCQDCHMPHTGTSYFALPEQGGLVRDPETIFSHLMPGASDDALLQNAVNMSAAAVIEGDVLTIDVRLVNDRTGHAVPTDSPMRHLILLVRAKDPEGSDLPLREGGVLPEWVGVGNPATGYYAGLPGQVFAKILSEQWTNITPTAAYWNPTYLESDNRLFPFEPVHSVFRFAFPENTSAEVNIRLLYRRAFIELADQKDWPKIDILMAEQTIHLTP